MKWITQKEKCDKYNTGLSTSQKFPKLPGPLIYKALSRILG